MSNLRTYWRIARIIWDGGTSFQSWLELDTPDALDSPAADLQDYARLQNNWGWTDPKLASVWADYDKGYHYRKNIGSEHARLDDQRAYKMYGFLVRNLFLAWLVTFVLLLAAITSLTYMTWG